MNLDAIIHLHLYLYKPIYIYLYIVIIKIKDANFLVSLRPLEIKSSVFESPEDFKFAVRQAAEISSYKRPNPRRDDRYLRDLTLLRGTVDLFLVAASSKPPRVS